MSSGPGSPRSVPPGDEDDRDRYYGERRPPSRDDGWRDGARPGPPQPEDRPPLRAAGLARHCLESGAVIILGIILLAALMPRQVALWMPAGALAAITAVTWHTALRVTGSSSVAGWLLAWGLLLTGWFTAARLTGLRPPVIAALIIPGIVLSVSGITVLGRHWDAIEAAERVRNDKAGTRLRKYWEDLLAAHGAYGARVLEIIRHDASGSLEIRGRLPRSLPGRATLTFEQLAEIAPKIAVTERRDPEGVYFSRPEGGSAADFTLHVRDKSAGRRAPIHLPVRNAPLTVNRPFGAGLLDSGREYTVLLRERHVQIIGVTGAGKSNLINVFLDRMAGMIDMLIWMIDMKAGRTSRPWIVPYLQGYAPRPVIDWVATTREEAKIMLETALLATQTRAGYPGFEKIIPSREVPAIAVVCDDVARCFGHGIREGGISNFGLAQLGAQLTEQGRSEAVMLIGAGQRANVELWGGTGFKAMSELRFGLRCTSAADGAQIFPDSAQAARMVARLQDDGDCLVKDRSKISPVVHLYRVGDKDRVAKRALWAGDYRPAPEQRLADAMGDAYADRWQRSAGLLDQWREDAGIKAPPDRDGDGDPPAGYEAQPDFDREFDSMIENDRELGHLVASMPDPEGDVDPRRKVMWKILRDAGWQGMAVKSIGLRLDSAGAGARRETVHRWLADDEQRGWVRRGRRGTSAVWIWCGHGDADAVLNAMQGG